MTLKKIQQLKAKGEKIAMLTCYDASFARLLSQAGVDIILVGDSLGNVILGQPHVTSVTLSDITYHTKATRNGAPESFIMGDLPFMTYATPVQTFESAAQLMQAGANMVKLEAGIWLADTISQLVERGIPVCAHLGLSGQACHQHGYRIQGRGEQEAAHLIQTAKAMEQAGASIILLECIPYELTQQLVTMLSVPTIGIGAGNLTDGQVLVLYDLLGIYAKQYRFVKNFMETADSIQAAIAAYVKAVKQGVFPAQEHTFFNATDFNQHTKTKAAVRG